MHGKNCNTAVDYVHAVQSKNVSNCSAAAAIDLAKLSGLECNAGLLHDRTDMCNIFCVCIIGAGFSAGTCKFIEHHAASEERCVFLFKSRRIRGIKCCAYIRRKHIRGCQTSSDI